MSLPVSNQFRACTACPAAIDPGCKYAINLSGDVVCEACVTPQDLTQYEEPESPWFDDHDWDDDYFDDE